LKVKKFQQNYLKVKKFLKPKPKPKSERKLSGSLLKKVSENKTNSNYLVNLE